MGKPGSSPMSRAIIKDCRASHLWSAVRRPLPCSCGESLCTSKRTHAHTHARTHTCTSTHARTHARTHAHTHTHTHARTHTRTHQHYLCGCGCGCVRAAATASARQLRPEDPGRPRVHTRARKGTPQTSRRKQRGRSRNKKVRRTISSTRIRETERAVGRPSTHARRASIHFTRTSKSQLSVI